MNFRHRLVLITDKQLVTAGAAQEDDWGQASPDSPATLEVRFLGDLQPRSSTEVAQANDAGTGVGTHLLFAPVSVPITRGSVVRWDVDGDPRRYQVRGDPRDAANRRHHLEVDLVLVSA